MIQEECANEKKFRQVWLEINPCKSLRYLAQENCYFVGICVHSHKTNYILPVYVNGHA
jgi:hypothetical protein